MSARSGTPPGSKRALVIVGSFPKVSETFVVQRLRILEQLGWTLTIVARPAEHASASEAARRFMDRFVARPRGIGGFFSLLRSIVRRPSVISSLRKLNVFGLVELRPGRLRSYALAVERTRDPEYPFDLVWAESGDAAGIACALKGAKVIDAHTPVIAVWWGSDAVRVPEAQLKMIEGGSAAMVAPSAYLRHRLEDRGLDGAGIEVIPPPIDEELFAQPRETQADDGLIHIVTVGRLVALKGVRYIVEAVATLPPDIGSRVRLHVVGGGDERPALERLIDLHDAHERITLHGWMEPAAIAELLGRAEIAVQASVPEQGKAEAFGVAAVEAMARGCALIVTDCGGLPELVEDGVNGVVVPHSDAQAIREAIEQLVQDNEMRMRMGDASRSRYRELFAADSIADKLSGLGSLA